MCCGREFGDGWDGGDDEPAVKNADGTESDDEPAVKNADGTESDADAGVLRARQRQNRYGISLGLRHL